MMLINFIKNMHFLKKVLIFGSIVLAGCVSSGVTEDAAVTAVTIRGGEEFELAFGQSGRIAGTDLEVVFEDVFHDSRCPSDVQCVTAGNVRVVLLLRSGETELERLRLGYGGAEDSVGKSFSGAYSKYIFQISDVYPYPVSTREIPKEDYGLVMVMLER